MGNSSSAAAGSHPAASSRNVIGIDIGDKLCELAMIDAADQVSHATVKCSKQAMRDFFSGMPSARVILEASTHSGWLSRALEALGHEVIVANPRRVKAISDNRRKNDRNDALTLAWLGKASPKLLHPIQHRSEQAQQGLALLRSRDALVRSRTLLINAARGLAKTLDCRLPACDAGVFEKHARSVVEPFPEVAAAILPLIESTSDLTQRIRRLDGCIEALCESVPATRQVRQVKGVGAITALCFVLTLDDPKRFKRSRDVGAYLGLVPAQKQSGSFDPQLPISKEGDGMLRRLLVGSAQWIMMKRSPDTGLKRFGLKISGKTSKGAKKKAAVAVARKLAVLLHRLWVTGQEYEPQRGCEALQLQS